MIGSDAPPKMRKEKKKKKKKKNKCRDIVTDLKYSNAWSQNILFQNDLMNVPTINVLRFYFAKGNHIYHIWMEWGEKLQYPC